MSKKAQAINLFSGTIKVVSYLLKVEVPHPLCALRFAHSHNLVKNLKNDYVEIAGNE